jgi:hypothetical protein
MSATNPPPIRVPRKFAEDPELFAYFHQELHTFLRLLWARVGQGDADDDSVLASVSMPALAKNAALEQELASLTLQALSQPVNAKDQELEHLRREIASLQGQLSKFSALSQRMDNLEKQCLSQ